MNFKRLLHSQFGIYLISIVLGLGLATLFRKVCTDRQCIVFEGPVISDFVEKTYKHGEKCYQYKIQSTTCNPNKKIIDIKTPSIEDADKEQQSKMGIFGGENNGVVNGNQSPKPMW